MMLATTSAVAATESRSSVVGNSKTETTDGADQQQMNNDAVGGGRTSSSPASSLLFPCSSPSSTHHLHPHPSPPPPTSSSASLANFSAANLFGLFERIAKGGSFDTNFGNNDSEEMAPIQADETKCPGNAASISPLDSFVAEQQQQQTPAIDKLLQISQQFLNGEQKFDGKINGNIIGNFGNGGTKMVMENGGGEGQRKTTEKGRTADRGGEQQQQNMTNGGRASGSDSRKRSYPYTFQFCVLCQKNVHSSKLPCHIRQCHVGKPMFQCPVCDFTSTYSKNNVKSHMVSLHGLAGDPISYMDQYSSQVEEFMKQCFPNVRGRGRPLHGRLSPNKQSQQQQLLATPARSTAGTTVCSSNSSPADVSSASPVSPSSALMTPPQRRHHPPNRGGRQQQQRVMTNQRGAMNIVGMNEGGKPKQTRENVIINGGAGEGLSSSFKDVANNEVYGAAAMVGMPSGQQQQKGVATKTIFGRRGAARGHKDPLNGMLDNIMHKGAVGATMQNYNNHGFPPSSMFNPFLYLQQINTLFSAAANPAPLPVETMMALNGGGINAESFMPKIDMDMTINNEKSTMSSLEECLSLSQKFLKEMNKEAPELEEQGTSMAIEQDRTTKESLAYHSSSSTASPPTSTCQFPTNNTSSSTKELRDDEEPRFFPQPLDLVLLDGPSLDKTVFKTFANPNDLIEKMDLTIFESLLEQNSRSLLTTAQREIVAAVRKQLGLKSFEIMFAVHRLDIDVLRPENVQLVARIAPTELDIRRFRLFEQCNPSLHSLDDAEQFVMQLSKIDRLRDKLAVMALMGEFDGRVAQLNQHLLHCSLAAKLLHNSSEFHTLLHLLLICANLINGDFSAQLIKGFRPHRLAEVCSAFHFPGGSSLLDVLAQVVREQFASEFANFAGQCKIVEEAAKVDFEQQQRELCQLERGQLMVEEELQLCDGGKNQQLANFLTHCELECAQLRESIQSTKTQIASVMEFFAEPSSPSHDMANDFGHHHQCLSAQFFSGITKFVRDLQTAINSIAD